MFIISLYIGIQTTYFNLIGTSMLNNKTFLNLFSISFIKYVEHFILRIVGIHDYIGSIFCKPPTYILKTINKVYTYIILYRYILN